MYYLLKKKRQGGKEVQLQLGMFRFKGNKHWLFRRDAFIRVFVAF